MPFFIDDNESQWVALTLYCLNILYSYFSTKSDKISTFDRVFYWFRIILCIAAIVIYYIYKATLYKNNEIWNQAYFGASIVILFIKGM